jgi:hypothetical protein
MVNEYEYWDTPGMFSVLTWNGSVLVPRVIAVIAVPPMLLPQAMARVCAEDAEEHPGEPACAYQMQLEAWTAPKPADDASEETKLAWLDAALHGGFAEHPDRLEQAHAYTASVRGDLWIAIKTRGQEGVEDLYVPAGTPVTGGGNAELVTGALVRCARMTAQMFWPTN